MYHKHNRSFSTNRQQRNAVPLLPNTEPCHYIKFLNTNIRIFFNLYRNLNFNSKHSINAERYSSKLVFPLVCAIFDLKKSFLYHFV
jgi:hypothetical protein